MMSSSRDTAGIELIYEANRGSQSQVARVVSLRNVAKVIPGFG